MPTYEYRCTAGHRFELVQRMSDSPAESCPTCGAEAERLLSAGAGFLFRGDGFYITDYRSEDYRKAAKADSGGAEGTGAEKGDGPAPGSGKKAGTETTSTPAASTGAGSESAAAARPAKREPAAPSSKPSSPSAPSPPASD